MLFVGPVRPHGYVCDSSVVAKTCFLDEFLYEPRLAEVQSAGCLLHMYTEKVLQRVAFFHDVLRLKLFAKLIKEFVVRGSDGEVVDVDAEHDLATVAEVLVKQAAIVD